MPNCFHLVRKGEKEPTTLTQVDREVCEYMEVPEDKVHYCYDWFNVIGFLIASGKSLGSQDLRIAVREWTEVEELREKLEKILDFLEQHFVSDAWVEIGRRDR